MRCSKKKPCRSKQKNASFERKPHHSKWKNALFKRKAHHSNTIRNKKHSNSHPHSHLHGHVSHGAGGAGLSGGELFPLYGSPGGMHVHGVSALACRWAMRMVLSCARIGICWVLNNLATVLLLVVVPLLLKIWRRLSKVRLRLRVKLRVVCLRILVILLGHIIIIITLTRRCQLGHMVWRVCMGYLHLSQLEVRYWLGPRQHSEQLRDESVEHTRV